MEQMGLQGKEETQHSGKLELEGKWAEKIAEGYFCLSWVIFETQISGGLVLQY